MTGDGNDGVNAGPVRVLYVVQRFGRAVALSGSPRLIGNVAEGVGAVPGFATLLCVLSGEDPVGGRHGYGGAVTYLSLWSDERGPARFVRSARGLRRVIAEWKPHIVHSALWPADMVCAMALPRGQARHVVHILDTRPWLEDSAWRNRLRRFNYKTLLARSHATFVACSEGARAYAGEHLRIDASRIHLMPNAIPWLPEYEAAGRAVGAARGDLPIVGAAGRLRPEKDHRTLIEAVARLSDRGVKCRLQIAGGGSLLEEYKLLARQRGIADRVGFLGRLGDMTPFYRAIDVFAMPSRCAEGLPLALLEAMAAGLPVVATDVVGTRDAVTDGREGFLVPPGDADAMADALGCLLGDPGLRRRMGEAGRETVRARFTMKTLVQSMTVLYRQILTGR
ncbi:MAG: glycosyltransferase family 4 protein [Phycisphaerae bacterium]|nr:glycosyltransferase family 4 protein [Phycisphaerae bacterium]